MRWVAVTGMILSLGLFAWCDEKEELKKQLEELEENIQKLSKDLEVLNSKREELQQKIKGTTQEKGYLGIIAADLTEEQKKAFGIEHGVVILDVVPNTPAAVTQFEMFERSGNVASTTITPVQRWDVIIELDGEDVKNVDWLKKRIQDTLPGQSVQIRTLKSNGSFPIRLVRRSVLSTLQLDLVELSTDQRSKLGLGENEGLLITSQSEPLALHVHDILIAVARRRQNENTWSEELQLGNYKDLETFITERDNSYLIKVLCSHGREKYEVEEREFETPASSMGHDF